ncbi:ABC transporter substrate-binding protein [Paenibacillus amylolyticus]|uniref:ABC transporter substrate-binding protein n=1 Tax=Paenibacillus amylolyticus TaxID=1451 RepID=A0A5M9WS64_PAEAM|nr:ABC transporter substrate-binding protein [Paenibacillus amylolyticus]KAA8784372.1 ABC transporter substrate-binding protein [Paenibacillus amylolyticus]
MLRQRTAYMIFLSLLMLVLAACGKTTTEGTDATSSKQNTTAEEKGTQTVNHLKGTSVVPQKIERMVVLSAAYIDHMLSIGEKPAGVNVEVRYGGDYLPYLADQLQGVPTVGSADSPNLEAIVQIDPDVIVIESRTAENSYDQLEKIAPTIVLGDDWMDYKDDTTYWTQDLLTIAGMYNKVDLAKEKIAEVEQQADQLKGKIEQLDTKKLAYLRVREKNLQIYAAKGHPTNTLLYHDLGFEPSAVTPADQREDLSMEKIADIDANYVVLEADPNAQDYLSKMKESALWKNVPAVGADQVYQTDSFWLFKGWGVIGRSEILNEIKDMIQ